MRRRPLIPPRSPRGMILPHQRPDGVALLLTGEQLQRGGQLIPALRAYRLVAETHPKGHAITRRAMFLAALCAYQMRLYGDAIRLMEAVRGDEWANPDVHYNLALMYDATDRPEDAAECYRVALALKPDYPAAETNLGNILRHLGEDAAAELCYARVLDRAPDDPEARYNLAHVLLARGDLARGFAAFEERWRCAGYVSEYGRPDLHAPRWTITAAAHTVLVHAEQGFGDTVQFLRYVPLLLARGLEVVFEVQPLLLPLVRQLATPRLTICARGAPLPPHDAQIPLLSLTAAFATTPETIPPVVPLVADGPPPIALPPTDGLRVGIVWAGNPNHHNDRTRSSSLAHLAPLLAAPDTQWVSLQVGPGARWLPIELGALMGAGVDLLDVSHAIGDFRDTANLLATLDLVIAVDTSVAHLAATMGLPTWLLLPHIPEWRWPAHGETCPWYPTLRIFRQPARRDWSTLAATVAHALEAA